MVVDEMKWQEMFSYFMQTLCRKHASTNMKLLDFLNFIQPELLVPFLATVLGGSDFVNCFKECIKAKILEINCYRVDWIQLIAKRHKN